MQFTKLRLHGFKSFVESTELLIEPGLTGIVGPNGCGKSNLVEALQWVMGETSARRLRGADMDDVIFGGTSTKAARNVASVTLWLDNADRKAPSPLNDADELEIDRRIDRAKGSTYRVNGREFRARDLQILFADAASGAQSVSLIGQGRIGWLIAAKPTERRLLLEEAAGIGGLHARRHEAELRLSAAETNLTRLSDVQAGHMAQLERLKKQARQAERYRKLSEQLRQVEALSLYRHWLDQRERLTKAKARLVEADERLKCAEAALRQIEAVRIAAHAGLSPLRTALNDATSAAERQAAALIAVVAEQKRVTTALIQSKRRAEQLDQDIAREHALATDAGTARVRLIDERATLHAHVGLETTELTAARDAVAATAKSVASAESVLNRLTSEVAAAEAATQSIAKRLAQTEDRSRRLQRQIGEADQRSRDLDLLSVAPDRLADTETDLGVSDLALVAEKDGLDQAERAARHAEQSLLTLRPRVQTAERMAMKTKAEIDALKSLVNTGLKKSFAPVVDAISVTPGLETALGAVLGDDLLAALDPNAPVHWSGRIKGSAAKPILPDGAEAFSSHANAPDALQCRLDHIGVVADFATGENLQPLLEAGQRLVSRDGAVWRWDGLKVAAGAPTAAAMRLAQQNRLRALEIEKSAIDHALTVVQGEERDAATAFRDAQTAERARRTQLSQLTQRNAQLRQELLALNHQNSQAQARQQAAAELSQRLTVELVEVTTLLAEIQAEQAALPDTSYSQATLNQQRQALSRVRQADAAAQRELDRLTLDAATRQQRLSAIGAELEAWTAREQAIVTQLTLFADRQETLLTEIHALANRPEELEIEQQTAEAALKALRTEADAASLSLKNAETAAQQADIALTAGSNRHAEAREALIRADASHEQAAEAVQDASNRARAPFNCPAEHLPRVSGIPVEAGSEATEDLDARLDRLRRDRDAIGPVNLMAESEIEELTAALEIIRIESEDLVGAIARLRLAIQQLNKEGRDRLTKAFDIVNEHFQTLFQRLFGGGNAYLQLTGVDGDPLAAGLEIMASPPGKKTQVLSLLSGGERALTALALVFAVFLTNPAPVCVLDEVDAPLDDANVERFCRLVREISDRVQTRFLIITHHRVTMAQMDRLYGVTMVEKGISQLVSVELQTAERLRHIA